VSINRRHILGAAAAATGLAACSPQPVATTDCSGDLQTAPLTFLLIHGTWHGGWVWKYVRQHLEDQGHRVFTPTLTGCGEREHLSSPDVGLDTHIQDIVNVIEYENLRDIFISAHSFSGVAMTGAVDRLRDRITHVNFFDALVPREGRMSAVERDPDGGLPEYFLERRKNFPDGYKMVFEADYPLEMLLPVQHPRAGWVRSKLSTHPARTWTDTLTLANGGWEGLPRSYIHCVGQEFAKSSEKMIGPARGEGWNFIELEIPRNGMVTDPEPVARTFLRLAVK